MSVGKRLRSAIVFTVIITLFNVGWELATDKLVSGKTIAKMALTSFLLGLILGFFHDDLVRLVSGKGKKEKEKRENI